MPLRISLAAAVLLAAALLSPPLAARGADESTPLAVRAVRAFPELRFRRPIIVTHAGDGTNRLFVASQQGVIYVLPNRQDATESDVETFLDMEAKVTYKDNENEEGFLGMAFHPRYQENGQFFVYYTTREAPHVSVISRFRVSADNPNRADPEFEQELLRVPQPFWNHNGGTLAFGPDGYLYIALGDGGSANDPQGNGQNLQTLLGSILRIDVDHHDQGRAYAVPKDNPFVGKDGAQPEIWAYGLRNPWRISFDRKTGELWCGDVGQDLWEEIDLIVKGGNYGWNLREGKHPFGEKGVGPREDLIEPIWEYHHEVGKSITAGVVYRGTAVPELAGCFCYADYVSGKLWALKYNHDQQRVAANYLLEGPMNPWITYGEDEAGEVYVTDAFGMLYRFESAK